MLTPEQVAQYRNKYGIGTGQETKGMDSNTGYTMSDTLGDIGDTAKNIVNDIYKTGKDISSRGEQYAPGDSNLMTHVKNVVGAGSDLFKGIGRTIGNTFSGAAKIAVPQSVEDNASKYMETAATKISEMPLTRDVMDMYNNLNTEEKAGVDNILGYLEGVLSIVTANQANQIMRNVVSRVVSKTGEVVSGVSDVVSSGVGGAVSTIANNNTASGVVQIGREMIDRGKRAATNAYDATQEAAQRAETIKASTPAVQQAIRDGVSDRAINTVKGADTPTLIAYKQMLDIADNPYATLKQQKRPEIVAGEAASSQYKLIEKKRRDIGAQIGSAVDDLSNKTKVDVLSSQRQMRDVLRKNGILPDSSGTLQFTGKFTPNERSAIQKLYTLATEGGEKLSPRQIYDMDQLFSKLQREARFENVGDLRVTTPDGDVSLYSIFRDIYSSKLESLSPQIRTLNSQYRKYRNLQDNIEDSIVKQGNFETKSNPAEFAQTNLRRIMSDAQSAAAYREILQQMDAVARMNGYKGARPDDLIEFATYLREVYPDTIPRTSLPGSIKTGTGVMDVVDKVISAGAPTTKDQQKALRALIEEAIRKTSQKT